jgi:hypothetical protein
VFHTCETRPGWVPSLLRDGGVLPTSTASLIGACRFATASPIPRWNIPSAELLITEHAKIHSRSPVRPSPRPPSPDGTRTASASTPGFAPRSHPRRTPRRGRSHGHWTGSRPHQSTSNRRDHSQRATSRRTAALSSTRLLRQPGGGVLPPPLGHTTPRGALQHGSTATPPHITSPGRATTHVPASAPSAQPWGCR